MVEDDDPEKWARIQRSLAGSAPKAQAKRLDMSPRARSARSRKLSKAADGRSARAKGRTAQLNIRCRPDIKASIVKLAERDGLTITEWMERAVEAQIGGGDG